MTTIALIDGDIFAYEAAAAAEEPIYWGDDLWTLHAFETPAREALGDRIRSLQEAVEADQVIIALSDKDNFRKRVLPTYKENRANVRKPMLLKPLKQYLRDTFKTYERPSLEGDDVLGILATWSGMPGDKVIVTKDKDFRSIPAKVYYANRPEEGILTVSEFEADKFHMLQTLTGDSTDGYKGCPGCGPVKASKVLQAAIDEATPEASKTELHQAYWRHVVATYAKAGLSEEEALVQARCARILRATDYDFKKKEVILWKPPT